MNGFLKEKKDALRLSQCILIEIQKRLNDNSANRTDMNRAIAHTYALLDYVQNRLEFSYVKRVERDLQVALSQYKRAGILSIVDRTLKGQSAVRSNEEDLELS